MPDPLIRAYRDQFLIIDDTRVVAPVLAERLMRPLEKDEAAQCDPNTGPANPARQWQRSPAHPIWIDDVRSNCDHSRQAEDIGCLRERSTLIPGWSVTVQARKLSVIITSMSDKKDEYSRQYQPERESTGHLFNVFAADLGCA